MLQPLLALLAALVFLAFVQPAHAQLPVIPVQSQDPSGGPGSGALQPGREQPTGFESAKAQIEAAERYRSACRDIRGALAPNSPLRDFTGSQPFINAITEFCAYGNFILRGQPQGQTCTDANRMRLDQRQFTFILALNKIGEKIGRIDLECVEYNGRLYLESFDAISLRLISSRFQRLFLFGGTFSLGIAITSSELTQGIGILGANVNGQVTVSGSRVGNDPSINVAFAIAESNLRTLRLSDTTIEGALEIFGIKTEGDIRFEKITIKGNVNANRASSAGHFILQNVTVNGGFAANTASIAKDFLIDDSTVNGALSLNRTIVGALLRFKTTTVTGNLQARFLSAGSVSIMEKSNLKEDVRIDYAEIRDQIWIEDSDFEKQVALTHNQVNGIVRISKTRIKGELQANYQKTRGYIEIGDSEFSANVWMDYARVEGNLWLTKNLFAADTNIRFSEIGRRVYVANENRFEGGLWLNRLRAPIVELRNSESGKDVLLTGSQIGELLVYGMRVKNELFAGNSRLNVLAVTHTTVDKKRIESDIGLLDCSDCVVEHYILLGARISKGVRLTGTRINGSLNFSEGNSRASWHRDAVLDLTGVQAQVIQADDSDLQVMGNDKECPGQLVEARLSGVKFDSLVGGRVMDMKTQGASPAGLFNRPVSALKEWMLSKPSCWNGKLDEEFDHPDTSYARFDPQPFEVFAAALERSGRLEAATNLRILKRDEEIKVANYNWVRRGALWLGRFVVRYGYENERALFFFGLLWFAGWVVYLFAFRPRPTLKTGKVPAWYSPDNLGYAAFYSLDRAVPQLTLDKGMDRYSLIHPGARYYFYAHRVMGACILIYAVAGLTGVLK